MSLSRHPLRALAAALALAACAACASSAASEQYRPHEQRIVLPAGEPNFVLFGDGEIAKHGPAEALWTQEAPGLPSAAGYDLGSSWACVGYREKLALVGLGTKRVVWPSSPLPGVYRSIGVHDETAALTSEHGERVVLVSVLDGAKSAELDAAGWLAQFDLDRVDYALPTGPCSLLLIASRNVSFETEGRVMAILANGCQGGWTNELASELVGLTWVHRCASDGRYLYVAGLHEETQLRAGREMPRLLQRIVVLRFDPQSHRAEELVFEERLESGIVIQDLAVGTDALAVLLESGELTVWSLEGGRRLYRTLVPGAQSVAWVGPARLVTLGPGGIQPVSYGS